ncbi:hypothetical protein AMECASPLE_023776 [Ameca splendens]|uniref:Uncharacterized protein n=1 Tax=Ameca splendens TaxID=208324 RepID=A0ABV0ZDZ2_9TELE
MNEKSFRDMSQQSETGLGRRFYVLVAGKTNGAHQSIVEKMKNVGQVEAYSQDDCDYLLVFCPIASRVQTDINEALRKIQKGTRGFMGVCPTGPHVFCGPGEGIRLCPS